MVMCALQQTPSSCLRHVASDCSHVCSDVCPKRSGNLSSPALSLYGTSVKLVCDDGRTESPGPRVACQEVFSPIAKWKANVAARASTRMPIATA